MDFITKVKFWMWRLKMRRSLPAVIVNAIPVEENNEPMVNIRGEKLFRWGGELSGCSEVWLRGSVYYKLCNVAAKLPSGLYLKIYSAYRSIDEQKLRWERQFGLYKVQFPNEDEEKLYRMTRRFVADPRNGYGSHQSGAAIDLTLCDSYGTEIDMGTELGEHSDRSATKCRALFAPQKRNRKILWQAMAAEDFVNYPEEWWHFCCGDRMWAAYKRNNCAYYGPCSRP